MALSVALRFRDVAVPDCPDDKGVGARVRMAAAASLGLPVCSTGIGRETDEWGECDDGANEANEAGGAVGTIAEGRHGFAGSSRSFGSICHSLNRTS